MSILAAFGPLTALDKLGGDDDMTDVVVGSLLLLNSLSTNTLALLRGAGFGAFAELDASIAFSFLGDLISSFIFLIMFIEVEVGALGLF